MPTIPITRPNYEVEDFNDSLEEAELRLAVKPNDVNAEPPQNDVAKDRLYAQASATVYDPNNPGATRRKTKTGEILISDAITAGAVTQQQYDNALPFLKGLYDWLVSNRLNIN